MTDFELNSAIYKAIPKKVKRDLRMMLPDYCNNWSDLMPLVVEREMDLIYQCGDKRNAGCWKALAFTYYSDGEFHTDCEVLNANPQRALAECLLKVLEAK